jgi:hypothetical protein
MTPEDIKRSLDECDEAEEMFSRCGYLDPRCAMALETKRRWLRGEATSEELAIARKQALEALEESDTGDTWITAVYAADVAKEDLWNG